MVLRYPSRQLPVWGPGRRGQPRTPMDRETNVAAAGIHGRTLNAILEQKARYNKMFNVKFPSLADRYVTN